MLFRLTNFRGEIPKADPTLLPAGAAQRAVNANFDNGTIRAMLKHETAYTHSGNVTDFIAYDGEWLAFANPTTYAPGPVADDRLYYATEGDVPRLREMGNGSTHPLALPSPNAPLTVGINTNPADDPDDPLPVETVVFVYTWVSDLDEESLPSPVSFPLDVKQGATVDITIIDEPPVASRINRVRIYRSQTSAVGTTGLYFVKELSVGANAYVHDLVADPLQELLPSDDFDPPVDTLEGLTPLQQGMIAGFSGRSLYFCEPYQPHAWPLKYELKTDYDIVALAATGNTLMVLTKGTPYICSGTAPENMILERLDQNLPCVGKYGVVDLGSGVAYPSHDGLVMLSASSIDILTRNLLDRRAWRALKPETFRAGHYDGNYVFTHDLPGGNKSTAMFDLMGEQTGLVRLDVSATRFAYDLVTGSLYFSDGTTAIREFAAPGEGFQPIEWTSGILHLPVPGPFGVIKVDGALRDASEPFTAKVYADGNLHTTITAMNEIKRLKAGYHSKWYVEITGAVDITRVSLAGDPDEIMGG